MSKLATFVVGLIAAGAIPVAGRASDADLVVSGVSVSTPVRQGEQIQVANTVTADPAGAAYAGTNYPYLYFFLSTDPTLSSDDKHLATRNVPALQPGQSSTQTTAVQLPGDVYGTRYLIVILDGHIDTTSGNNRQVVELQIVPPDLFVSGVSVASPVRQGAQIEVANTVTADPAGAAYTPSTASLLYFFLSTDPTYSSDDRLLASRTVPALPPGQSSTAITSVQLPADAYGPCYLIVILDGHVDTTPDNNRQVVELQLPYPAAAAPTFSPAPGVFSAPGTVTITDATPGATIYYTIDGTIPTAGSTPYRVPITISTTSTISAIAVAPEYSNSDVATATYTMAPPGSPPSRAATYCYDAAGNMTARLLCATSAPCDAQCP